MKGPGPREILGLTFVLSVCSLVYEMTIAACFVRFTGDAPLWQSLTIGLYLGAIGLGSFACSRIKPGDDWAALWRIEVALCAAGAASAAAILSIETAFRIYQHFYSGQAPKVGWALAAVVCGHSFTILIGWLSGFEIPLLLRLARSRAGEERMQQVLGVNYLGALAGSLLFSFWLMPALDVTGAAAVASALNLAACAYLYGSGAVARRPSRAALLGAVAAAWVALVAVAPPLARLNLTSFYAARLGIAEALDDKDCCSRTRTRLRLEAVLDALWDRRAAIEHVPSRLQRIDLITRQNTPDPLRLHFNGRPNAEPDLPFGLALYLDRRYQFYGGAEAMYHEFLGHVPIQLFERVPEDILILGGGDALLAKEFLKYGDRVRSITNVELDPAMVDLARNDPRLRRLSGDAFRDPKVRVVVDDAFFFVRQDRSLYDAIYIDFPFPYNYDAAKLYTVEFFRNVAARLKPGGFCAMDYPLATQEMQEVDPDKEELRRNSIAVATLRAAGFQAIVPYATNSPELVTTFAADQLREHPRDPEPDLEVQRLLRKIQARRYLSRHRGLKVDESRDLTVIENTQWRESMLAFSLEPARPSYQFKDYGVRLHSLNAERLKILEGGRFPFAKGPQYVNSVPRPTLFRSLQFIERD